jgi:glycolate oxidase FAD binding subunit
MTVTVEAGVTLEQLASALAAHGQFLPVRPASGLGGTVGGMLAANDQGMLRHGFGTARDWLIGIAVVQADGTLARAGGRVVKNVAGYDLGKVFIGSLGTLGVIAEATFKLAPLPQAEAGRAVTVASPHAAAMLLLAARDESLALHSAELLSPPAAERVCGERRWAALLRVAGGSAAVARTLQDAGDLADGMHGNVIEVDVAGAMAAWEACFAPRGLAMRCSVLPSQVADAVDALAATDDDALISATLGAGVIRVRLPHSQANGLSDVDAVRRIVGEFGGHIMVESAPPELKATLDVFGAARGDFAIMRRLKDAFDPGRILAPGRFLGRL